MIKYVTISAPNLLYEFQAYHHRFLGIYDLIKNTASSPEIQFILLYESKNLFDFPKQQNKLVMAFLQTIMKKPHI